MKEWRQVGSQKGFLDGKAMLSRGVSGVTKEYLKIRRKLFYYELHLTYNILQLL